MKHARADYDRIQDPAGKIAEDEPVFLIRGKDVLGPTILMLYADHLKQAGGQPEMVELIRKHADAMNTWQGRNGCKVPDMPL